MSPVTFVQAAIVLDSRRDPARGRRFDDTLLQAKIGLAPIAETLARIARLACRDYGRGSGHPARLNFGGCFARALGKSTVEPLLFKGDGFT